MIRALRDSDLSFIRDSWFASFAESPVARSMIPSVYARNWRTLIDRLLERGNVVVDCDEENTNVIIAWACFGSGVLHYIFTRPEWRRRGRARALLGPTGVLPAAYSHRTTFAQQITARLPDPSSFAYDPVRAWEHFHG